MSKGTIAIDQERCKGCELCTFACPKDIIKIATSTLNRKGYHPATLTDPHDNCTGCAICAVVCPDVCISVFREARPTPA